MIDAPTVTDLNAIFDAAAAFERAMPCILEKLAERLPAMLIESLREQWNRLSNVDKQIADVERRL